MAVYCPYIYDTCYMVATNEDYDSACDYCYYYHLASENCESEDGDTNEKSD